MVRHTTATKMTGRSSGSVMSRKVCHAGGAVHARGLAGLVGHCREAGQHQQGHEGRGVPDVHDDQRPERQARVAQPGHLGQADEREQPVETPKS